MMDTIPIEFRNTAREFTRKHLAFLDRNWLNDVFVDLLARLVHTTVKEHTSETSNTALREACKASVQLVDHVKAYLPSSMKSCRCMDLNDGEHRPQPACHWCALSDLKDRAAKALETP